MKFKTEISSTSDLTSEKILKTKDKCIVLHAKRFEGKLRRLSVFTKKHGKLNVIVSLVDCKFPVLFEPFSVIDAEIVQIEEKFELKKAKLLEINFPENLKTFKYLNKLAFLVHNYTLPPNQKLFEMLRKYLKVRENFNLAYTSFLIKFCFFEGIFPDVERCKLCGSKRISLFSVEKGGTFCRNCLKSGFKWSLKHTEVVRVLLKKKLEEVQSFGIANSLISDIMKTLERHVERHLS
jgi:DNA repair protein RecO (recombination protein O)